MGIGTRVFLITFCAFIAGISLSYFISEQGFSEPIMMFSIIGFSVALIASIATSKFAYSNIADLAEAASKIADGSTKKKDIKALQIDRSDEFGNLAKSFSNISEDLKSKINIIAKQRDQFGSVLNDLGEGIIIANIDGEITYSNDQFKRILNMQKVVGKNISDLGIQSLNYLYKRAKKKKRADVEFEIEINNKKTRWVLGSINQSKTTQELLLVIHDITQLRRFTSMRRDFVSNVSHELRTPVSVIRANSETLVDGALEDKKQAKVFAKAILHNAERLTDMVSGLLDLSRIEYGDLKLNIQKLDINKYINGLVDSLQNLGKKRDIKLKFNPNINNYKVLADREALERILTNLIDNAFKYSEDGSSINIFTKSSEDYLEINVEDEGRGVEENEKSFIFDRFYRTAEARATEEKGSGLGLAIVKNLVISLNGEVGVKDANKKGSIFWFTLPLSNSD